jgi:hypothetical protein
MNSCLQLLIAGLRCRNQDDDLRDFADSRGRVPAFGGVTDYLLVLLAGYDGVDFGLPFDVSGD